MKGWLALPLLLVGAVACGDGDASLADAAADVATTDGPSGSEVGAAALAVDFTARGCGLSDGGAPRCTAAAPAMVEFIPISAGSLSRFLWDFGDGSPRSSDRTPTHTYTLPGTYDVRVVAGGAGGSVEKGYPGFVTVTANEIGHGCDVDAQCASGLTCVCGSAGRCSAAFPRGLCSGSCRDRDCRTSEVCAELTTTSARPEPWQAPLCLRACTKDGDCPTGLRCRDLPGRGGAWVRGCFSDVGGDVGAPCRNAVGQLVKDLCLTGVCADLGANGTCSLDCARGTCPPGAACARLQDGRSLCVRICGASVSCLSDPLLACTAPNAGPLGFQVAGTVPTETRYCAPRTCSNSECPPVGVCRDDGNGAHCVRRDG